MIAPPSRSIDWSRARGNPGSDPTSSRRHQRHDGPRGATISPNFLLQRDHSQRLDARCRQLCGAYCHGPLPAAALAAVYAWACFMLIAILFPALG